MLVMATIGVHAQFSISNSTQRRVIVAYELGSDGYYKRVTKKSVERVDNIVGSYAYDKKAQNLYVITPSSIFIIQLLAIFLNEYIKFFLCYLGDGLVLQIGRAHV